MGTQKDSRRLRIKLSIRAKISGSADKPRLSVFRSNTGIYAQVIDDVKGHTLVAASSKELGLTNGNVDSAKQVGAKIAEKALAAGVSTVVFEIGSTRLNSSHPSISRMPSSA